VPVASHPQFVYHQSVNVEPHADLAASRIAAAIGEPARARMLYSLLDGHARTSTELAVLADVTPSTASAHLNRLKEENLVKVHAQGKHRYYSLAEPNVATALESLSVLAGAAANTPRREFTPNTPSRLRAARTCYDHIAGSLGVALPDRLHAQGWLSPIAKRNDNTAELTTNGARALETLRISVEATEALRRRFAFACLDWSERRPHLGGALAAAILHLALKRKWLVQDLDSRALAVTSFGRRELHKRFGLSL
jgi:DNA-binding transcriptional ArsR family regulator